MRPMWITGTTTALIAIAAATFAGGCGPDQSEYERIYGPAPRQQSQQWSPPEDRTHQQQAPVPPVRDEDVNRHDDSGSYMPWSAY